MFTFKKVIFVFIKVMYFFIKVTFFFVWIIPIKMERTDEDKDFKFWK